MKLNRLAQAAVAVVIFLIAGASPAAGASKYRVITEGELGFKRGNTFFALRLSGADFETRFGAADKKIKLVDGYRLAYMNEGIAVLVVDGAIRSITFVIAPAKTERYETYQAANAATSSGIGRSSSIEDVIKAEGPPTEKSEDAALSATMLRYTRGRLEYSFRFKDGVLSQITLTGPRG